MATLRVNVEEDLDGSARLTILDPSAADERTQAIFAEYGRYGNGYDWGEVGQALTILKMPERLHLLFFDPEGDYLLVLGPTRALMDELAEWLRRAIDDPKLLEEAIEFAQEHGLDGCTHG
jgi:hypothetical protein